MKVSVLQEQLDKALTILARAVDNRVTLPVLGNVLFSTEDARLKLAAMNQEVTITTYIGAKVDKEGAVTLPARTLTEMVKTLSPERVDLTLDAGTLTVNLRCGVTNWNVRGIAAAEFPPVPEAGAPDVVLPGKVLREMIAETVFACAKEDTRPILTGLYLHFDGNVMTVAAADGYRLAVRTARIDQSFKKAREMVVPAKTMAEVARIIFDDDIPVSITLPGDRELIQFEIENTVVSSQLIDGRFPDFSGIIPKTNNTVVSVYTDDLLKHYKRAEIFARDNNYSSRVTARPAEGPSEPGAMHITAKSSERGDYEGVLEASVQGAALDTSFNVRYLIDVLSVIPEERILLESNGTNSPGVIRPEGREDFLHLIMPMSGTR
jgi:DNA polymerase III subunit beta